MTTEEKQCLCILLEKFKEEKLTHDELITILECLLTKNTYYPLTISDRKDNFPYEENIWWGKNQNQDFFEPPSFTTTTTNKVE